MRLFECTRRVGTLQRRAAPDYANLLRYLVGRLRSKDRQLDVLTLG